MGRFWIALRLFSKNCDFFAIRWQNQVIFSASFPSCKWDMRQEKAFCELDNHSKCYASVWEVKCATKIHIHHRLLSHMVSCCPLTQDMSNVFTFQSTNISMKSYYVTLFMWVLFVHCTVLMRKRVNPYEMLSFNSYKRLFIILNMHKIIIISCVCFFLLWHRRENGKIS